FFLLGIIFYIFFKTKLKKKNLKLKKTKHELFKLKIEPLSYPSLSPSRFLSQAIVEVYFLCTMPVATIEVMGDPNLTNEEMQLENDVSVSDDDITDEDSIEEEVEIENNEVVKAPEPAMLFNSVKVLYEYYNRYAKQEGFEIRKDSSRRLANRKSKVFYIKCT
ncbi:hypothetical protein CFOL_v3_28979, partial [Cephalotus follicularis]